MTTDYHQPPLPRIATHCLSRPPPSTLAPFAALPRSGGRNSYASYSESSDDSRRASFDSRRALLSAESTFPERPAQRLSELLDCPSLRKAADVASVAHVSGAP